MLTPLPAEGGYIIMYGKTGVGKSWLCNMLKCLDADKFVESSGPGSCSKDIRGAAAWNNVDIVTDLPGLLDSDGDDDKNLAKIQDTMKDKRLRAILCLTHMRDDSLNKLVLDSFASSEDFRPHLIQVRNMVVPAAANKLDTSKGYPVISIGMGQADFSLLKAQILQLPVRLCDHMVAPGRLFPGNPPSITRTEHLTVKLPEEMLPMKVDKKKMEMVLVQEQDVQRPNFLERLFFGEQNHVLTRATLKPKTSSEEQVVSVPHAVSVQCKVEFAMRFDNVEDVYRKTIDETTVSRTPKVDIATEYAQ